MILKLFILILLFSNIKLYSESPIPYNNSYDQDIKNCLELLNSHVKGDPKNQDDIEECKTIISQAMKELPKSVIESYFGDKEFFYSTFDPHKDPPRPDPEASFFKHKMCFNCHEMKPLMRTYYESNHYKNPSGMKAYCGDCHIRPGAAGFFKDKFWKGMGEAFTHSKRNYEEKPKSLINPKTWFRMLRVLMGGTQEKVLGTGVIPAKKRKELSHNVRELLVETDSINCTKCHNFKSMNINEQNAYARKKHAKAIRTRRHLIREQINLLYDSDNFDGVLNLTGATEKGFYVNIINKRKHILDPLESKKITCVDCHPYPAHQMDKVNH